MRIKLLKKNDKPLFAKRKKGFYGRVFVLGVGDHHVVLQHIKNMPKTCAVLTYCDTDLFQETSKCELLINVIQRNYLKKYRFELLLIKSYVSLPQFSERDGAHWLELAPVSKQTSIDFGDKDKNEEGPVARTGGAKVKESTAGPDAGAVGVKGWNLEADMLRDRKGKPTPEPEHPVRAVQQLELAIF